MASVRGVLRSAVSVREAAQPERKPVTALVCEIGYRDPLALLGRLPIASGLVFLDSAAPRQVLAEWSWIGIDPFGRFVCANGRATFNGAPLEGPPLVALRRLLEKFSLPSAFARPSFCGGATGYFAYEAGGLFERLPTPKRAHDCPQIDLWFHDLGLAFNVVERRAYIVSTGLPASDPDRREKRAAARADWLAGALRRRDLPSFPAAPIEAGAWRPDMSAAEFKAKVERVRRYIGGGDIFQANLTQAFRARLPEKFDPLALYRQLRDANPAPYSALIVSPERLIVSTSPEGFLRLADGEVETRPIKGTRRRSANEREDRRLAGELVASGKDRAENVMIVDLMRNDLSRVCAPGSVIVPTLCGLESYASIHHLVSVVRGRLRRGCDALDLLAACFPGGSITGAPKIRAMEIIHELEAGPRGVYCGSIVHLGFDGALTSSIAIRTLVVEDGVASLGAGGGITLLSDPEEEYAEMQLKAERIISGLAARTPARAAS
jgi:para-aminobenzoate synthetase component 1